MKTKIFLTLLLLCRVGLHAQQGEILYYEFTDACDASRNGLPAEGTHFDIDGDSTYDFHTTAGIAAINRSTYLGLRVDTVGWAVYPCFLYDIISNPTMPGWVSWVFTYLPEGVRIDTLRNSPEGFSRWDNRMYQAVNGATDTEPNITENSLMIAIRHEVSGNEDEKHYCYGWIECSMNWHWTTLPPQWSEGLLCVKRMAYCTILDYPMRLGQTSLTEGLEEAEATAFATIHPNPTNGQVTITGKDLRAAEVFNTLGQHIATVQGEGEQMTVDISALPSGVYFVNITDKDGRKCMRKVVKE